LNTVIYFASMIASSFLFVTKKEQKVSGERTRLCRR